MSIEDVRRSFVGGNPKLRLHKSGLTYAPDGRQVLQFTGWHEDGTPFAIVSAPFVGDPDARAAEIARDLAITHTGQKPMGKFATVGQRMQAAKTKLEARADAVLARLDAAEKRGTEALDAHERLLDVNEADIAEMERSIAQMSNGAPPLDDTSSA